MKELQKKELEIFLEVIKIIKKYNLRYFAIGGTCIGAVRHRGFIPWDDDIDIAMPREDYEILIEKALEELPDWLEIMTPTNTQQYECLFTKIHDKRTTYIEKKAVNYQGRYTGIFIDIMPIDGTSDFKIVRYLKTLRKKWLFKVNGTRRFDYNYAKSMKGKIFYIVFYPFKKNFSYNYFSNKIDSLYRKYNFERSKRISFTWRLNWDRDSFLKSDFSSYIEVPFENTTIRIPVGYDRYLTKDFGNYMQLPPKEEQKTIHMLEIIDLEKSYTEYIK